MIDDKATPPPLKGSTKSLAERYEEIRSTSPDPWTMAWIKGWMEEVLKAYRGVCHLLNICVANGRDTDSRLEKQAERIEVLENEVRLLQMGLGEARSDLTIALKRIEDMAAWAATKGKQLPERNGNAGAN